MTGQIMNKQPVLEVKNVYKAFGGIVTARDISFDLHAGEILGLIGPNGAGKTTALNLISGIYDIDQGDICFCGESLHNVPSHERARRGIARTFQSPRFLQRSTIRDNMMLGNDLACKVSYRKSFFSKQDTSFEERIEQLFEIAGLSINWEDDISSIPYGNRKLLEIVRALLTEPKVMLVDEPAAGLNRKELERVTALLRYCSVEKNIGVILIEHAMDFVTSICDRIVVLNFGEIIKMGKPDEVVRDERVIEAYLGKER